MTKPVAAVGINRGVQETTQTAHTMPVPDWPIRDLFFHLQQDLSSANTYERVGMQIKDKLSTGQLKVWGRKKNQWGNTLPYAEIESSYWQHANFTYYFLLYEDDENEFITHTTVDSHTGLPEYGYLQVNQAQASKIWPEPLKLDSVSSEHHPEGHDQSPTVVVRKFREPSKLGLMVIADDLPFRPNLIEVLRDRQLMGTAESVGDVLLEEQRDGQICEQARLVSIEPNGHKFKVIAEYTTIAGTARMGWLDVKFYR